MGRKTARPEAWGCPSRGFVSQARGAQGWTQPPTPGSGPPSSPSRALAQDPFWRPGALGALGAGPQLVQTPWWKGGEWSGHPRLPPPPQVLVRVLCVMLFRALSCIRYVAGKRDCFQAGLPGTGRRILFGLLGECPRFPGSLDAGAAVSHHTCSSGNEANGPQVESVIKKSLSNQTSTVQWPNNFSKRYNNFPFYSFLSAGHGEAALEPERQARVGFMVNNSAITACL